jgi:nicotinate phosphoribosyltransferase
LLIDTYDTLSGAEKALRIAAEMSARGNKLRGVRLDSGDMTRLSKAVREIFKKEGRDDVSIFASGGFDEYKIADSVKNGAEIDAFGVGTKMGTSADSPYTDMAYKLVQYDGRPVLKLSTGKKTLVGCKQVFRRTDGGRFFIKDSIALRDENVDGEPLLRAVMKGGERLHPMRSLDALHERFQKDFKALDNSVKAIENPDSYPVEIAPGLEDLQRDVIHEIIEKELGES